MGGGIDTYQTQEKAHRTRCRRMDLSEIAHVGLWKADLKLQSFALLPYLNPVSSSRISFQYRDSNSAQSQVLGLFLGKIATAFMGNVCRAFEVKGSSSRLMSSLESWVNYNLPQDIARLGDRNGSLVTTQQSAFLIPIR